jgi:hypothetical protein
MKNPSEAIACEDGALPDEVRAEWNFFSNSDTCATVESNLFLEAPDWPFEITDPVSSAELALTSPARIGDDCMVDWVSHVYLPDDGLGYFEFRLFWNFDDSAAGEACRSLEIWPEEIDDKFGSCQFRYYFDVPG